MGLQKKIFILGFIVLGFFIFSVNLVFSQENISDSALITGNDVKEPNISYESLEKAYDIKILSWTQKIFYEIKSLGFINFIQTKFNDSLNSGPSYFFIGLFAGFYIWIVVVFRNFFSYLKQIGTGAAKFKHNPFTEDKMKWISLIAGRLWKVLLIGLFYFVIMQIPFINVFVKTITLDIWVRSFFLKTFILAFEIGFLPAIVERISYMLIEVRGEKAVQREKKLRAMVRD